MNVSLNLDRRKFSLVKILMIKVRLLEAYLPVVSSKGPQHARDGLCVENSDVDILQLNTIIPQTNYYNNFKVKNWQSKRIVIQVFGTTGRPKVSDNYGRRAIIVLANARFNSLGWGKIAAKSCFNKSHYSTNSTMTEVKVIKRLKALHEKCINKPNIPVTSKLYKLICDVDLLIVAYSKLKSRPGQMTPGVNPETLDGMSSEVLEDISKSLKSESFSFSPGKRIHIPKASGGTRPLTVGSPRDKLVQEAMRMILEAIFEPTFLDCNHGFRPFRSCHTALKSIRNQFQTSV